MRRLERDSRGTEVYYAQLALQRAGFSIAVDGILGERTCGALRDFLQKDNCVVDEEAWDALMPYLKGYTEHVVREGDTIWKVAEEYETSARLIQIANPNLKSRNLFPGMTIRVPYPFALVPDNVPYSSELNELIVEGLHARYPFIRRENAGRSVLGKPLWVLRIGAGETQLFYSASYHANEWINSPVLLKFVEEYAGSLVNGVSLYGTPPEDLFMNFELFVLPLVNPDGVDLVSGTLENADALLQAEDIAVNFPEIPFPEGWKANIEGVDLNLQFPAGWEQARQIKEALGYTGPAPRDYVGQAPLIAPESRAVYTYTGQHDFRLILAYHTQGEVIYWKYLDHEPEDSRRIALYFGEVSGYAVEETPIASGYAGYKDWFIKAYDRPGYTIETGRGTNPLPLDQFAQIYRANVPIFIGAMTQLMA